MKEFEAYFQRILKEQAAPAYQATVNGLGGLSKKMDSLRWQLSYLIREGVDLGNPRAIEVYDFIRSEQLPTAEQIAYEAIIKSGSSALKDKVVAPTSTLSRKVRNLSESPDLKPAASTMSPYISALGYNVKASDKPKSWWSKIFGT